MNCLNIILMPTLLVMASTALAAKLSGTIIGTPEFDSGSNKAANAFDGNLETSYTCAQRTSGQEAWIGLDFGVKKDISKVAYCPRKDRESRLVNVVVQVANKPDFSDAVTAYTLPSKTSDIPFALTEVPFANVVSGRYARLLNTQPPEGYFTVAELSFDGADHVYPQMDVSKATILSSRPFDSSGSNAPSNGADGDTGTSFNSEQQIGGQHWFGYDFGSLKVFSGVTYCPRQGRENRLANTVVQVASKADFSDAVVACALPSTVSFALTTKLFGKTLVGRYVRLLNANPPEGWFSIAELGVLGEDYLPVTPKRPNVTVSCVFNQRANFRLIGDPDTFSYVIQRKLSDEDDSSWSDWKFFSNVGADEKVNIVGDADVFEDTDFRFRAENGDVVSEWVSFGIVAPNVLTGTPIVSPGSFADDGNVAQMAIDGSVFTWFDAPASPVPAYVGLDLGERKEIAGLRVCPREGRLNRLQGLRVEVADNANFNDARTVYTIPANPTKDFEIVEATFDAPATARYVRLADDDPGTRYCNAAEVEFETTEAAINITVSALKASCATRLAGGFPTITWVDNSAGLYKTVVYRATAAGGPWTEVARMSAGIASWKDETAVMGVRYYYQVAYTKGTAGSAVVGPMSETPAAYRRIHRLERTAEDNTKLKNGVRVAISNTDNEGNPTWKSSNAFDGDVTTSVGCIVPDSRIALVFDNGNVGVECVRAHYCSTRPTRLQKACVYATNNDYSIDSSEYNPQVSVGCFPYVEGWAEVECDDPRCFRVYYLKRPDQVNFYCCMSEWELYGWEASEESAILVAPTRLRHVVTNSGLTLSWDACNRAVNYRVEKLVDDAWVAVATVSTTACVDQAVDFGVRTSYRIVSLSQAGAEAAISQTFSFVPYQSGTGEGLTGVYAFPFVHNVWASNEESTAATNADSSIDFYWGNSALYPDWISQNANAPWNNMRGRWFGKIIIPFDGEYTFKAETAKDCSLGVAIGGRWVINQADVAADGVLVGKMTLLAGEHDFYAEFMKASGACAKFVLKWLGPIDEEVIPAAQFIPANPHAFADWTLDRTYATNGRLKELAKAFPMSDGSVVINRGKLQMSGWNENYHALQREVKGNFSLSFHLKLLGSNESAPQPKGQRFGIFLTSTADPKSVGFCAQIGWSASSGGSGACHSSKCTAYGSAYPDTTWENVGKAFFATGEGDLKIERVDGVVSAAYKNVESGEWVKFMNYPESDVGGLARRTVVKLAATDLVDATEDGDIRWKISDVKYERLSGLMLLVR